MQKIEFDTNLDEKKVKISCEKLGQLVEKCTNLTTKRLQKFGEDIGAVLEKYPDIIEKYPDIMDLDFLRSMLPANFSIANNKLANEMTKNFVDQENDPQQLVVIKGSNKVKEVVTLASLTYDDENITFLSTREFTPYDRTVHNAVCSLYIAGNEIITAAMVYRAMNGMTESEYVDPSTLEAVTESLEKSIRLRLKVDFTDEAKARNINVNEYLIEDYLLNAKWIKVRVGGDNIIEAYKINEQPILHYYAGLTKQILSVPAKLLNTKDATRNTERIIPIKEYLLRRIEVMKSNKAMGNRIAYDTIFKESGVTVKDRAQKERMRKYIREILNLWKERDGYIKDFSEYKERNSIKGIEIILK